MVQCKSRIHAGGQRNRVENAVIPPRSLLILDGKDRKGEARIFVGSICMYIGYKEIPYRRGYFRCYGISFLKHDYRFAPGLSA